jgi:hypothetical protein
MTIPFNPSFARPSYTHIPGVTPHPIGDPRGHSFGKAHVACPKPEWQTLPGCELFQNGCQLFNAGYYWEAHEAWEAVWIAAGRTGLIADFVKGLIKIAAAGVKLREASVVGAQRHLLRAQELLLLTRTRRTAQFLQDAGVSASGSADAASGSVACDLEQPLALVKKLIAELPSVPLPMNGQPIALLGTLWC